MKSLTTLVVLLALANIGNYSFLTYTYGGAFLPSWVNSFFNIIRVLLAVIPALLILSGRYKAFALKRNFSINWDIILLFSLVGVISAMFVPNTLKVLLYVIWTLSIAVVLIYWFSKDTFSSQSSGVVEIIKVFFYSHIIVLGLLILNIENVFMENFQMPFSSKSFYAYSLYVLFFASVIILHKRLINRSQEIIKPRFFSNILFLIFILIMITLFILISGRRSALLGIIILTVSFLYLNFRRYGFIIIALMLTIISVKNPLFDVDFKTINRMKLIELSDNTIIEKGYTNSYGERLEIWQTYAEIVSHHPIFGVGVGNSAAIHKIMFPTSFVSGYSPHNSYLAVLVEYGFVGLILLIIILIRNLYFLKRFTRPIRLYYLSFSLGLIIISLFEYNSSPGQILFIPILLTLLWPRMTCRIKV